VDCSGISQTIEDKLPRGARGRQLSVRTLFVGMLLAQQDGRPAHLTRVHKALVALAEPDQWRLGIIAPWKRGSHLLSYRQTERTFGLVCRALSKTEPDGKPSLGLSEVIDSLIEASVPDVYKHQSSALAVDWTDLETFGKAPTKGTTCKDTEASWGHRHGDGPGQAGSIFFGYFLQAATMVNEDKGPKAAELARRILVTTCSADPVPALVPVLERMHRSGASVGDVLADSGYAHRAANHWAVPLRALGARLVQDLHPSDRGPKGTHAGAVLCNGNLYCPATPEALLAIGPGGRDLSLEQIREQDRMSAELSLYKLGRICSDDQDGYHRVMCPAEMGKLRCPLRDKSMTGSLRRPEVLSPPQDPPKCCRQKTVTVPAEVCAKTAQAHDYPSKAHRRSYKRRTAAERTFASIKNPATNDISRGLVPGNGAQRHNAVCGLPFGHKKPKDGRFF